MNYFSKLYNVFFITICPFVLSISFSYAQDEGDNYPPGNRFPPEVVTEELTDPCAIPQDTDVVHFPIQSYTVPSSFDEAIDTVGGGLADIRDAFSDLVSSSDSEEDSEEFTTIEKTSYSQFILAKFIQENPNSFVFHESATRVYDTRYTETLRLKDATIQDPNQLIEMENPKPEHLFQLVNQQFPDGLPEKYNELSEEQKHTLAIVGGTHTLFFMNELPSIFPSISETYNKTVKDYSEHYCESYYDIFNICVSSNDLFNMFRADTLAFNVNNFLEAFSTADEKLIAVLVYREDDNLQDYFPGKNFYKMPESCISITAENLE